MKPPRGAALAIPRQVKRTGRGLISKQNRPSALLKRKRVFVEDVKGGTAGAIVQRVNRTTTRILYYLTRKPAKIRPRFRFRETARDAARKAYPKEFGRAFAQAIATRRT